MPWCRFALPRNAIDLAHALGIDRPKLAVLSAVETVNSRIPPTIDAAALCKMADRGQITGALVDGPLAFDNTITPGRGDQASRITGRRRRRHPARADLEAGNMLAKELTFLAHADADGIVLGARIPTSRVDDARKRLASWALPALYPDARRVTRSGIEKA